MRLAIQSQHLDLDADHRQQIERRVGFALSRLTQHIRSVDIHLCDLNGPRGGLDKRCRVMVHLDRGPAVIVEDVDSELGELIDRTIARAARSAHKRVALGTLRRRLMPWPARRNWMLGNGGQTA
jgi:putative sigma-54 modulation protein